MAQGSSSSGEVAAARTGWAWAAWLVTTCDGLTWLAVAAGVGLRVWEYLNNRPLYMDEIFLLQNLVGRPVFDLRTTLTEHQLAPPGFLVVERLMVRLPSATVPAARLVPLLCGVASVFLFRATARRYLDRRAVPAAAWLFAPTDYLLYYAAEVKQYSGDVALALAALWLAAWSARGRLTARRAAALAGFGAAAVWFSHPVALVLAGVGVRSVAAPARGRRWGEALAASAVCAAWALSFAACLNVSNRLLDTSDRFMADWWGFAFLRLPPRTAAEAARHFWQFVNVFVSPAGLITPFGLRASGLLGLSLWLIGGLALGRRWPGGVWLLTAPVLFTLAASSLHKYPFHGRLLMFLIPPVHLLAAEGIAAVGRRTDWLAVPLLVALLIVRPVGGDVWHLFIQNRTRSFDSHGDLWPDLLDEFDIREARPGKGRR